MLGNQIRKPAIVGYARLPVPLPALESDIFVILITRFAIGNVIFEIRFRSVDDFMEIRRLIIGDDVAKCLS